MSTRFCHERLLNTLRPFVAQELVWPQLPVPTRLTDVSQLLLYFEFRRRRPHFPQLWLTRCRKAFFEQQRYVPSRCHVSTYQVPFGVPIFDPQPCVASEDPSVQPAACEQAGWPAATVEGAGHRPTCKMCAAVL